MVAAVERGSRYHLRQSRTLRGGDPGVGDQQGIGVSQLAVHDTRALARRIIGQIVGHLLAVVIIVEVHNLLHSSKREHILSLRRAVPTGDIARLLLITHRSAIE